MASLVLGLAGSALGPVGGMLGAMAGAAIDSYLLFPAIFPSRATAQGRIKEFSFNSASEGSPIPYCLGPNCRVPGTIVWCSDLIEQAKTVSSDSGGKGSSASIRQFQYFAHLAVALCENQIRSVKKIWADGKLVYSKDVPWSFTSNEIRFERKLMKDFTELDAFLERTVLEIRIPNTLTTIDRLRFTKTITISGASLPRNNGTKKIYQANPDEITNEFVVVIKTSNGNTEAAGNDITISGSPELFAPEKADDMRVYIGTDLQTPDTLMESYVGAGDTPSYRGLAYVVFEKLALESYGNRLPQLSFLVEADETITIADAIGRILERGGLESTDYDTSYIAGDLDGYVMTGPTTTRDALVPIMLAYDLLVQESGGVLKFYPRSTLSTINAIAADDLAAQEEGRDPIHPAEIKDVSAHILPSEVTIRYLDPLLDYQAASQSERNQAAPVESVTSLDIPLALTATEARKLAARILWDTWAHRQTVEGVQLPPTYLDVEESDLVRIPAYGQNYDVRVVEVSRGYNGILEIRGAIENSQDQDRTAESPQVYDRTIGTVSGVDMEIVDVAPLRDFDSDTPGIYLLASPSEPTAAYRGATIFRSTDGSEYESLAGIVTSSILGETVTDEVPNDYIIDNDTATTHSVYTSGQNWILTDLGNPYGGTARVSARIQYASGYYYWGIALPAQGTYEVLAHFTAGPDRSVNAAYQITHNGGVTQVYVDQSNERVVNSWVSLGTYTFGTVGDVILYQSYDGSVCADAIRLIGATATPSLASGPVGYWDRENTVTVRVRGGQLQSHSEADVLAGKNHALIGSEVIAFQTVTPIIDNVYQLSMLLRGLRGTESFTEAHGSLERFALLDPDVVRFHAVNAKEIGQKVYLKAVAPGESSDDVDAQEITIRARTIYPFPPAQLKAVARTVAVWGDGLSISWEIRTRKIVNILRSDWRQYAEADSWGYQIKIYNDIGQLLRTINTLGQSFFYSNSQQQADGLAADDTITIEVYKFGKDIGRGLPATITATATV